MTIPTKGTRRIAVGVTYRCRGAYENQHLVPLERKSYLVVVRDVSRSIRLASTARRGPAMRRLRLSARRRLTPDKVFLAAYLLADAEGQVWEHDYPDALRAWIAVLNRSLPRP